MPEAEEFALDAPVSPARVLPGQLPDQLAGLLRDWRAARGVGIGPLVLDDAPVPGEQGAGCHDPVQPEVPGERPREHGDHGPVSPVRLRAGDLAAEDRNLMTQYEDLHVFGGVAAGEQGQPAERPDHEQVEEAESMSAQGRSPGQMLCTSFGAPQARRGHASSHEAGTRRRSSRHPDLRQQPRNLCLGGTPVTRFGVAWCGLTCRFAVPAAAGHGLT